MSKALRRRPDVIVEFLLDDELLFLAVRNIGDAPATRVRVRLEPSIRGLGGQLDVGSLALLRRLEFLGPGREIRALVDSLASYFNRPEPRAVSANVSYADPRGRRYRGTIRHDLAVFGGLPAAIRRS
jgi:hypothetical protein